MSTAVALLGDGAWGTAVATLLAHNGYEVRLWCNTLSVAQAIKQTRINQRYLPDTLLSPLIKPTADLGAALDDVEWIFEAVPVRHMRAVITQAKPFIHKDQRWVILSKGMEQNSLMLPSQIIDDVLGYTSTTAILAGPTFAQELAAEKISAVDIAAPTAKCGNELQTLVNNSYFNSYVSSDMIGVQICSALKNVIALALGMLDGAGYAQNTKAFMLTRGLHDMATLSVALGGTSETVYGLCGVGDLVLTATSAVSKNMRLGQQLGRGEKLDALEAELGVLPEGINTVQSVHQLMQRHNIDLPVCQGMYQVLFQNMPVAKFVSCLIE